MDHFVIEKMKIDEDKLLGPYNIAYALSQDALLKKLSKKEIEQYLHLYEQVHKNPNKIQKELEKFKENHKEVPEISNLLIFLYLRINKLPQAEHLIEELYQKHPDYLPGKINYADQLLRKKQLELIPMIFNQQFDLNELYPNKVHHVSEFIGFMVFMGFYHLAIQKKSIAEGYYRFAEIANPYHRSVLALHKALYKQSLSSRIRKIRTLMFDKFNFLAKRLSGKPINC